MKMLNKIIGSAVGVAAALALSVSTTQAQNLLVDPSFESGAFGQPNPIPVPGGVGGGWAQFGASIATPTAQAGTYSALIAENTWSPTGVYQVLSATPGETFTFGAFYMTPTVTGYATPALIQISYLDSTGAGIAGAAFGPWLSKPAANTWTYSSVTATAPVNTAYIGAYLMYMDNGSANGMYVDNASLTATPAPEPASLALVGMGLASFYLIRRRKS